MYRGIVSTVTIVIRVVIPLVYGGVDSYLPLFSYSSSHGQNGVDFIYHYLRHHMVKMDSRGAAEKR